MSPVSFHLAILRSASLLLPSTQRADWLAEWRSELWHIRRDPRGTNVTGFCMGAFRDAGWLRRNGPMPRSHDVLQLNLQSPPGIEYFPDPATAALSSPLRCLSFLATLGAIFIAVALLLPAARGVLLCALYPRDLVMLTTAEAGDAHQPNGFLDPYPTVSPRQFESMKIDAGGQFTGLAYYVPTNLRIDTPNGKRTIPVARTTPDLFRLLNSPSNPTIARSQWNLPGKFDRWLIEDETSLAALSPNARGFVLGRLRYNSLSDSRFRFVRLADRSFGLLLTVIPFFLFSCILVAIMTSDSRGSHPRRSGLRRSLFVGAKLLLVLLIVMFGSLDVSCLGGSVWPGFFDLVLIAGMLAARWILQDQRKRCPVCLRLLANPVRIGEPSRILLEWHGTELMCLRGHGMLYIPEWPAIWSGRQRWMDLGPSWGGLFP